MRVEPKSYDQCRRKNNTLAHHSAIQQNCDSESFFIGTLKITSRQLEGHYAIQRKHYDVASSLQQQKSLRFRNSYKTLHNTAPLLIPITQITAKQNGRLIWGRKYMQRTKKLWAVFECDFGNMSTKKDIDYC